jgi:hypothetical protein
VPSVKSFITSRPHLDLQAKFVNVSRIDIVASVSDIENYLDYEISKNNRLSLFTAQDMKLREDIVKSVSKKATGM